MEIRDPVHGTLTLSDNEVSVVDTPEYQRLRAIKQLGFSEFSFPGATHNRYLHSMGVTHLAGIAFDQIFAGHSFANSERKQAYRDVVRLAALLHDVGHGPLSHAIEEVMPTVGSLNIGAYRYRKAQSQLAMGQTESEGATHEDYTIKFITDSPLASVLRESYPGFLPLHIACLVDTSLNPPDDFFIDQGIDYRPILSQLVSSELDCDRMDYLERDSYFCGTNYGKFDLPWMIANLRPHLKEDQCYLAINRRALYTFDDFLISRHHMHLMVYFHHKSIIFEEMLTRYLASEECQFFLPSSIDEYTRYTDYKLFEHLGSSPNSWARRIAERRPFRVLIELHNTGENKRAENIEKLLRDEGIEVIYASSQARLSKYHSSQPEGKAYQIFVVDQYDHWDKPAPVDQSTEIFQKYEGTRVIDRLYVDPDEFGRAEKLLKSRRV